MRSFPNLPVIESILREAGTPLRVRAIVDRARGRLPTKSRTPVCVVSRDLSLDIKHNHASRFERVGEGLYALKVAAGG